MLKAIVIGFTLKWTWTKIKKTVIFVFSLCVCASYIACAKMFFSKKWMIHVYTS